MKKARTKVLLQAQIEQAMRVTRSNRAAAEYLRVGYNLYKKYAKLYKDPTTGKNLFEMHMNQQGRGITKSLSGVRTPAIMGVGMLILCFEIAS